MGWVTMSERDLQRIEVLTDVLAGRRTVAAAATVLAVSERQMYRLLAKYEDGGGSALIHKARGRQSNRSLNAGIRRYRRYAVEPVRTRYADFGPPLATEMLLEKHDLRVGRETLRRWMVADGLWLSRKQRRAFHQPRLRREHYGELIQIDGSDISDNLGGQYVELYDFADRPLEVRWKGLLLPYRVFSKDQRVSHTAIVENKRLGHALAVVKAQPDLRRTPKVMTNSEKTGYRKRARMVDAPPLVLSDALDS
jgi:transposase